MSGKLKKIRADYAIKPSFTTYSFREEDIPKPLGVLPATELFCFFK